MNQHTKMKLRKRRSHSGMPSHPGSNDRRPDGRYRSGVVNQAVMKHLIKAMVGRAAAAMFKPKAVRRAMEAIGRLRLMGAK